MSAKNIFGTDLALCSKDPLTGFTRTGCCETGPEDIGTHTVCAIITEEFLDYTKAKGNDLSNPNPMYGFPGLKPGDQWCLCVSRWHEAYQAGCAPKIDPAACHEKTLDYVSMDILKDYFITPSEQAR